MYCLTGMAAIVSVFTVARAPSTAPPWPRLLVGLRAGCRSRRAQHGPLLDHPHSHRPRPPRSPLAGALVARSAWRPSGPRVENIKNIGMATTYAAAGRLRVLRAACRRVRVGTTSAYWLPRMSWDCLHASARIECVGGSCWCDRDGGEGLATPPRHCLSTSNWLDCRSSFDCASESDPLAAAQRLLLASSPCSYLSRCPWSSRGRTAWCRASW